MEHFIGYGRLKKQALIQILEVFPGRLLNVGA